MWGMLTAVALSGSQTVAGLTYVSAAGGESSSAVSRPTAGQIEVRRQKLLQQMVKTPRNLDLAYEYAELSAQVGDYQGAIATLERMLVYAPDLPRLQFELGLLYYRIGAYNTAQNYFALTLSSPNAPAEVLNQVRQYQQQILLAEPPPWSGTFFSGIRWQSDANSAPDSQQVTLNGFTFNLDDQSISQPAWGALNIGTAHWSHDLEHQGGRLEADVLAYSAMNFEQTQLDTNMLEVTFGPSFNMKRWYIDRGRLQVYGIGTFSMLGDSFDFGAGGAGMHILTYLTDRSWLDIRLETRVREFNDTTEQPNNSLRDGPQTRGIAGYSYSVTPNLVVSLQGVIQREAEDAAYFSNWEYSFTGGLAWGFRGPFGYLPWSLQLGAGAIWRNFDEPDPTINPFPEVDSQFWGRAALAIPVAPTWNLIPSLEYRSQTSNYDISNFNDLTAMVGLQKEF